jgi:hypothetical protein
MPENVTHSEAAPLPHQVTAHFSNPDRLQEAVSKLSMAGFDRADLAIPSSGGATPESSARPADTDEDARQARTMHTSTGASIAAMAAAGITIATGGAAAPAIAAAVAAGGLAGGGIFAISSAANSGEQKTREQEAANGALMLSVHAPTPQRLDEAEAILRAAGGTELARV